MLLTEGADKQGPTYPLEGVRVLDLTWLMPGGFATLMLADFGAEVIKIERPGSGDYWRDEQPQLAGVGARFAALNRNKSSLTLNLKHEKGRAILLDLVESADVLIEGFRAGVMARLGLGWHELSNRNGRLIMLSLSSFGQSGPWRDKASHDINVMGLSGALELSGGADAAPAVPCLPVGDIGAGSLMAVVAILLALRQLEMTGEGQAIDIAMLDGLGLWLAPSFFEMRASGTPPRRGRHHVLGGAAWYRAYRTRCGGSMVVGAYEQRFWSAFCNRMGVPEFINQQFADAEVQQEMMSRLESLFAARSRAEWEAVFADEDCCVTPSYDLAEAFVSPQMHARKMLATGAGGEAAHVVNPIRLAGIEPRAATPSPTLGQDSAAVLRRLGLDDEAIAGLRREGVI